MSQQIWGNFTAQERWEFQALAFWTPSCCPRSNTGWGYYFKPVNSSDACKEKRGWHRVGEAWMKLQQVLSSSSHYSPSRSWLPVLHAIWLPAALGTIFTFTAERTDFLRTHDRMNGLCNQSNWVEILALPPPTVWLAKTPKRLLSLGFLIYTSGTQTVSI